MPTIDLGYVIGPQGPQGPQGVPGNNGGTGPAGPNQVTGSTSTTLNGILQGNGSVIQAVQSDSVPIAGSNNIVRSGVVFNSLQRKSNHNFLANWLFIGGGTGKWSFPVNTLGKSSYPNGSSEWIDAWDKHSDISATLQSNCIALTSQYTEQNLRQYFGDVKKFSGKTVTLSVLVSADSDTTMRLGWTDDNGNHNLTRQDVGSSITLISETFTVPDSNSNTFAPLIRGYYTTTTFKFYIYAAKLELGTEQTLAHQENGVWVLNDLPDWAYEELKCKMADGNRDLAFAEMIAPVERSNYASRKYTSGNLFVWRGYLYRATITINSNVEFLEGTNCEQTTIAAQINV